MGNRRAEAVKLPAPEKYRARADRGYWNARIAEVVRRCKQLQKQAALAEERENQLQASEQRFRNFIEGLPEAVLVADPARRLVFLSNKLSEFSGVPRAKLINQRVRDLPRILNIYLVGTDHLYPMEQSPLVKALKGISSTEANCEFRLKDKTIPLEVSAAPFYDGHGRLLYSVCAVRDISERRRAERQWRESRKIIDAMLKTPATGMALVRADGMIRVINEYCARLLKKPISELIGKSAWKVLPAQAARQARKKFDELLRTGKDVYFEEKWDDRYSSNALYPVRDEAGKTTDVAWFEWDITERQQAQAALKESEVKYRRIVENSLEGIWMVDAGGRVNYANPSMAKMLGYTGKQMLGKALPSFVPRNLRPRLRDKLQKGKKGITETFAFQYWKKDGSIMDALVRANPVMDHGKYLGAVKFVTDITGVKKMADEIEAMSKYNRTLFETAPDVHILMDTKGVITDVNAAIEAISGYSRQELVGTYFSKYQGEITKLRAAFERVLREGQIKDFAADLRSRDGKTVSFLFNGAVLRDESGKVTGVLVAGRDVTARKQAEAALAAEKERLAVTLRSIGDGVITTDTRGRVELLNAVAEQLTGWTQDDARGRPLEEVLHIMDQETGLRRKNPAQKALENVQIGELPANTVLISRDGTERSIADSGAPIRDRQGKVCGAVLVFRDVTEKLRMEEELQRAQRLESLSVLAGGIAHDFNNILVSTIGNLSLMKMEMDPSSPLYQNLIAAEKGGLRAKDLTRQLLTFARGGAPIKKVISIAELIRDSCGFALRGSKSRCQVVAPGDLWMVKADTGQISQVISNLLINADQAMPGGGIVTVKAENTVLQPENSYGLASGKYVKISIRDEGVGIPKELLTRIFDPFFTTKPKGAGIGLTISYSIIRKHNGNIGVKSAPGKGATFYVFLPAAGKARKEAVPEAAGIVMGKGRILVMDDEEMVRDTSEKMLRKLGYEPEFARDGAAAVEVYAQAQKAGKPFDAVILDLTVPGGMSGKEAIEKLLQTNPNIRAIVSSGYSNDPVLAEPQKYGFKGMVIKPYEIEAIGKVLSQVLKAKGAKGVRP